MTSLMRRGLKPTYSSSSARVAPHGRNDFPDEKGIETLLVLSLLAFLGCLNDFPDEKGIETPLALWSTRLVHVV